MQKRNGCLFFLMTIILTGYLSAQSTVDNFESYTNTTELKAQWEWRGIVNGSTFDIAYEATGGVGGSKAMSTSFTF